MSERRIILALHLILFYGLTRRLPDSTVPGGAFFRRLRYWNCRAIFAHCGRNVNVERGAYIGRGRGISVGDHSGIGIDAWIGRGTTIGSRVMMGPEVMIFATNHKADRIDVPMMDQGMEPDAPVTIGDDVWIGARAILLPGVTVHSHSIIGAGAVVARDVPSGVIVAGNPARVVKHRALKETNHADAVLSFQNNQDGLS